ncbi:MAG: TnsA endonuclease C-terminal domain-containing protein [Nostoc sp.]|uniref:TnsA endonuclease C-terminal domain-containing protein n=1 Tax=Nostoc sp. TaxID=1180 RepID=UPI002FF9AAB4
MSKGWTLSTIDRRLNNQRGLGVGKQYKPWLTVRDQSSSGRSAREPGWKTGRVHHFHSDLERYAFYMYEFWDQVLDIREQFPMFDVELAMTIAKEQGMQNFRDPKTKVPYIYTTDFMLTMNLHGQEVNVARAVKSHQQLNKLSVRNRLLLEQRYWAAKGIEWQLVTEQVISKVFAKNVEWVHNAYWLEPTRDLNISELLELAKVLKLMLRDNDSTVTKITTRLDKENDIERGTSLYLFKYLVAKKEVIMDMFETQIFKSPSTRLIKKIVF